jgi:coenzyme F420 hydrogenase subunit beta
MESKTFKDLIQVVHQKGICQQCGGCVSFCSSAEYNVIGFKDPFSPPEYIHEDKCLECGICYCLCPQTHFLEEELNKTYNFSNFKVMPIGNVLNIYSCQSNDADFLKHGTDGGVVNSIIYYLIEKKLIDGAIVSNTKAPFSREAAFSNSKKDLLKASGINLDMSPHLDKVQKFSSYPQTIPELNHYKFKKLAVVGTPCQIYTMRCMENLGVKPSQNIEICLGLFCYENFLFDPLKIKKFENDFKINFEDIEKINIKEDLIFKLSDKGTGEKIIHIPFNQLTEYMRPACRACNDFTNIYADISFGGLGSSDKYTTILTRTAKGQKIITEALGAKVIRSLDLDDNKKNKIKTNLSQYSQSKLKRFETFMKDLK